MTTSQRGADRQHSTREARDAAAPHSFYILPSGRADGFRANIRGHLLDLADPMSSRFFAPTPDDLFVVAVAADFAWFARSYLRDCGVDDYVAVSAGWDTRDSPMPSESLSVTVTVALAAAELEETLTAELRARVASRPHRALLHFRVRAQ